MKRFRVRAVNFLLLGLIALGGVPLFEVRHSHEGGAQQHCHAREEHQSHDQTGASVHHGHPHTHDDGAGLRHEMANEVHGHSHPHQDQLAEAHIHDETQPAPVANEPSGQPDSDDWHLHGSWFGWLIGEDPSVATSTGAVTQEQGSLAPGASPVDEFVRSPQIRASLIWMHGPPGWFRPIGDLCADQSIQLVSLQSASPPLCDMSRHERSGVLLI